MKVVESVVEKRLCKIQTVNEIAFILWKGTIDAVFIIEGCRRIVMLLKEIQHFLEFA